MARVIFLTDFSEAYARELLLGMARYAHDTAQAWSLCRLPLSIRDKFGIEAVVEWAVRMKADAVIGQFYNTDNVELFRKNGIIAIAQDFKKRFTTIPNIIYWGDMDANGLDILSKLRATGIPCTSILMDTTAYQTYEQYGTQFDAKNKPLTTQTPQPTPGLTTEERKLYETLCTGTDIQYLRIEQERIPIRDATTILHDQHHWPIDIPGNDIPNNNTK